MPSEDKPKVKTCWEIADDNIRDYTLSLKRGEGVPKILRDNINKWLEYRHEHGPEDKAVEL